MGIWQDYHMENPRLWDVVLPMTGYWLALTERWFVSGQVAEQYNDTHHYVDLMSKLDWLHEHKDEITPIFYYGEKTIGRYDKQYIYHPQSLELYSTMTGSKAETSMSAGDIRLFEHTMPHFWNEKIAWGDASDLRDWGQHHNMTMKWLAEQLGENIIRIADLPKLSPLYNAKWLEQQTRIMKMLKWGPCPFRLVYSKSIKTYNWTEYHDADLQPEEVMGFIETHCLECDGAEEITIEANRGRAYRLGVYDLTDALPLKIFVQRSYTDMMIAVIKLKRIEMVLPTNTGETPTFLTFYLSNGNLYDEAMQCGEYEENKRYFLDGNTVMADMFTGFIPPKGDISKVCGRSYSHQIFSYEYGAVFKDMWSYADYTKSIFKFKNEE